MPALMSAWLLIPGQGARPAAGQHRQSSENAFVDSVDAHLARGQEDLKNNRYQKAGSEFRAALALDPNPVVRARFPLAVALFILQDVTNARKEFEAVRAKTGDDPNLNYYLGRLDLMEGKLDSAIHNLTLASSQPPFPDTPYYLGYAYLVRVISGRYAGPCESPTPNPLFCYGKRVLLRFCYVLTAQPMKDGQATTDIC